MIKDQFVKVTIRNQGAYYRSLGYGDCKYREIIKVHLNDLKPNSNKKVQAICDDCSSEFVRELQLLNKQPIHRCYECSRTYVGTINGAKEHILKISQKQIGENHPRWNPNKPALKEFTNRVHWLTHKVYESNKSIINPNNYPRTLCGVDGGYQLDHIVSIKEAFEQRWTPEQTSALIIYRCFLGLKI